MNKTIENKDAAEALALWIAQNQPEVFRALAKESNTELSGLAFWGAIGSGLMTAVKSVGRFVASPAGLSTLSTVGGLYLQSREQKDALRLQTQMAQAGYPPAPVYSEGAYQRPVYVDPRTGARQILTPELATQLAPRSDVMMKYLPFMVGGGLLLLILILKR